MEHNSMAELPIDVRKIILMFVDNSYAVIALKRVSRNWYREILASKLLESIDNQSISTKMISYFSKRKIEQKTLVPTDNQPVGVPSTVLVVPFTSLSQKNELTNLFLINNQQLNGGAFQTSKGVQVNIRLPRRHEAYMETVYWLGCRGGLFMFDLADRSSFLTQVTKWISFCYTKRQSMYHNIVYCLVGLAPQDKSKFRVSKQEIELLADLFGLKYFQVESNSMRNLIGPMQALCEDMVVAHMAPEITEDLKEDANCSIM
jgi:hypothetical protein